MLICHTFLHGFQTQEDVFQWYKVSALWPFLQLSCGQSGVGGLSNTSEAVERCTWYWQPYRCESGTPALRPSTGVTLDTVCILATHNQGCGRVGGAADFLPLCSGVTRHGREWRVTVFIPSSVGIINYVISNSNSRVTFGNISVPSHCLQATDLICFHVFLKGHREQVADIKG